MSVRIDCTGSAVSTIHATAEEAALHRIAAALFEPVELPDGCPGLEARILAAIEELARERTEARAMAHEMAMEVDRLTREEATAATPQATQSWPWPAGHVSPHPWHRHVRRPRRWYPVTADLALGIVIGAATCAVVPAVLLALGAWWLWRVDPDRGRGRGRVPW